MNLLKSIILLVLLVFSLSKTSYGQTSSPYSHANKISLGLYAGQLAYDPVVGLEVTSPAFLKNRLSFRMRGGMAWLEQYKSQLNKWTEYTSLTTALVYKTHVIDRGRIYAEIGSSAIIPNEKFSDKKYLHGSYGLIGAELFFLNKRDFDICYYFGGGMSLIKAYAEKLEENQRYGNGFIFTNGFRIYF